MATLSELTIHQSDALKLQQEKNMKDVELQQCYARMEQVCLEIFASFEVYFCELRENHPVKNWNLNGGVITQAEPRPQAYAPRDDADIQIARPYGSHAPFKPRYE